MLLSAVMVAVGGLGVGIGLSIWWPIIIAAVFVAIVLGIVFRR